MPNLDELPEPTILRIIDYSNAAMYLTTGRHDWRIPSIIAREWATQGHSVPSTNRLARQFGTTRRTMCLALRRLVSAGIIRETGRTEDGRAMYAPCLEIADSYRAQIEGGADGQR